MWFNPFSHIHKVRISLKIMDKEYEGTLTLTQLLTIQITTVRKSKTGYLLLMLNKSNDVIF